MKSILTGEEVTYAHIKIEADVIVTATVLGFVGTRYHQGQPISFDYEHPSQADFEKWHDTDVGQREMKEGKETEYIQELQEFLHVLSAMSFVLEKSDPRLGAYLKEAQSPEGAAGELITGRAGGQSLTADERHRKMKSERARRKAKETQEKPEKYYQGRGAYTGMIDDPVGGHTLVYSTKRVIDQDKTRWHPGKIDEKLNLIPWGLIKGKGEYTDINLSPDPTKGLGPLPRAVKDNERIGYIHGMSSAIVESIRNGPWCTPFEMATGRETTKMASCFACTTYMYASGFPPSSTHLGRGESWVPPSAHLKSGEKTEMKSYSENVMDSAVARWHREVYYYLKLGTKYLLQAIAQQKEDKKALKNVNIAKKLIDYVNPDYHDVVKSLDDALENKAWHTMGTRDKRGGNLFLDALTVHESDWKRIKRTFEPVYAFYSSQDAKKAIENKIASGEILVAD